ncbi:hypothetical protein SOPP22_14020 [Shewanella sp. OPT22]|nr:hypothetical protein SOPP22_14020 [Shewanella sp. OPT22]
MITSSIPINSAQYVAKYSDIQVKFTELSDNQYKISDVEKQHASDETDGAIDLITSFFLKKNQVVELKEGEYQTFTGINGELGKYKLEPVDPNLSTGWYKLTDMEMKDLAAENAVTVNHIAEFEKQGGDKEDLLIVEAPENSKPIIEPTSPTSETFPGWPTPHNQGLSPAEFSCTTYFRSSLNDWSANSRTELKRVSDNDDDIGKYSIKLNLEAGQEIQFKIGDESWSRYSLGTKDGKVLKAGSEEMLEETGHSEDMRLVAEKAGEYEIIVTNYADMEKRLAKVEVKSPK